MSKVTQSNRYNIYLMTFMLLLTSLLSACNGDSSTNTTSSLPSGILFGTQNGMAFNNATLLSGKSSLMTIDNSSVQAIAMDSNQNIYAGTYGSFFGGFGAGKVFKYSPTGNSWTLIPGKGNGGSLDGSNVTQLAIDSNNAIYASTYAGNVFKYANNQWALVGTPLAQSVQTMLLDANNNLYVGTLSDSSAGEVYIYSNGSWTSLGSPDGTSIQSLTIAGNNLYAATAGNSDGNVYRYENNSWTAISAFTDGPVNALSSSGDNLYAGTAAGNVYMYSGSATTWNQLTGSLDGTAITALLASGQEIYAGTSGNGNNGQVYRYADSSWQQVATTANNSGVSALMLNKNHFYMSTLNNGSSATGMVSQFTNNTWQPLGTGTIDGTPVAATTIDTFGRFYVGTQTGVFTYSTTNQLWLPIGNFSSVDTNGVIALTYHQSNLYAAAGDGRIFVSNLIQQNWLQIASYQDYNLSDILINESGQLYASMNYNDPVKQMYDDGRVQKYNSTTGTWSTLTGNGPHSSIDGSTIQSIASDSSGNIYAATAGSGSGGFVWEYPADGNSWIMLGIGTLDGTSINSVQTDSSGNIYAATAAGNVFKYNSSYWLQLNLNPLDGLGVTSLTFDQQGNLYAATAGGMVWEYANYNNLWVNTGYGNGTAINNTGSQGV